MRYESAETILRESGMKCTSGRIALIEALMSARTPLTEQQIAGKVSKVGLNRVSIYRALDAFLAAGIIHRVESGDRTWRYAMCNCGSSRHCHPHFVCRTCGRVECLTGADLPEPPVLKPGYQVEEREYYVKGVCSDCAER